MAYNTNNPPSLKNDRLGGGGATWFYTSNDAYNQVNAANYFTDGKLLGMKVGDVVQVVEADNSYALSEHVVTAVTASGATISARVTA